MSERKKQIMEETVNIVVTHGHAGLTMRAVARASGIKLGALQYHYPTRIDLICALSDWISEQTVTNFQAYSQQEHTDERSLHALVDFLIEDPLEQELNINTLYEQLWSMALTEPVIQELLNDLYDLYLGYIEQQLVKLGVEKPRPDALVIMSMLEGLPIFIGRGRRWNKYAQSSVDVIHEFLEARYSKNEARNITSID